MHGDHEFKNKLISRLELTVTIDRKDPAVRNFLKKMKVVESHYKDFEDAMQEKNRQNELWSAFVEIIKSCIKIADLFSMETYLQK